MPKWGFLTNHALVLLHVAEHPNSTLREIAAEVGITERAALSILRALEEEGIVSRTRQGRRNRYRVDFRAVMAAQAHTTYTIERLVNQIATLARELRQAAPRRT
jgi:DNA-binding IclR family transcriptional regulator